MTQYGAGSALAAQCPRVTTPEGWRPWLEDADGPIPDSLSKRAQALSIDGSVSLGSTESYPLPGVTVLIRVEPRAWGRDNQGNLVEGCFRVGGIYLPTMATPTGAITPPSGGNDKLTKAVGILTATSLAVGTVATIVTIRSKS